MNNKFESIIRGRETFKESNNEEVLSKEELEQRRNDIIKHLTGHFTEKEVDEQNNPTVKRLLKELQDIDKQLYKLNK